LDEQVADPSGGDGEDEDDRGVVEEGVGGLANESAPVVGGEQDRFVPQIDSVRGGRDGGGK
jgi:hypothetical protein